MTIAPAVALPAATVLIVDDEPFNRKLLETMLLPEGYATESVASGEEALASVALHPPDLILLDIMMPGMDGYAVARVLKASADTSNIPIILITAQSADSARLNGLDAGAEDFLTKPVSRAELWLRVRNLLRLKTLGDALQSHNHLLEQEVQQRLGELQRAEQARYSEALKQSMVLNALPAHIALLDDQGFIVSVNEAWRRFARENGWESKDFGVGLNYLAICSNAAGAEAQEAQKCAVGIQAVLRGENTTFSMEYGCHSPSEQRWFMLTVTALRDGDRAAATVMHMNITALKLTEQALALEGLRNQAFLRNASDGVHILDEAGRVQEVSDSFCTLLGYSRAALIGAQVSLWDLQLAAPESQHKLADLFCRADRSVFETQYRCKDGSVLDMEVSAQRLDMDGQPMLFNSARNVTEKKRSEREILAYLAQIKTAFMSTVGVITALSELRDPYTAGHERRVGAIAFAIGAELGFSEQRVQGLKVAGQLHDIGKMSVPTEILSMPGRLSPLQLKLVQEHPQTGYDILKVVEFPWPVAQVALQHHERMDGSGYPQGLRGDAILLEARIMAVADVVEAMSSHRPYRAALGMGEALAEIERGRGTAYDATVVDACLNLFRHKDYKIAE